MVRNSLRWCCLLALLLAGIGRERSDAAVPSIRNLTIRGLTSGKTTTLIFEGTDLLPAPRVLLSAPISAQVVREGGQENRVEIDVTLPEEATPGIHNLFLATDSGVSERLLVAVDKLPQLPLKERTDANPAALPAAIPVALHGVVAGSAVSKTTFLGKAGEPLICEVEAQRLGSKLRPVLHLYGPDRRHLALALPSRGLRDDCRLAITLPADGEYTVTVHDLQYNPPGPSYFRLKLGMWQYVDRLFPVAVTRGSAAAVELLGSFAPGSLVNVTAGADLENLSIPWPAGVFSSGPAGNLSVSDLPELIEQPTGAEPQEISAIPAAMNGRLLATGEEDRYRVKVAPESRLRFEVFSERIGSPVDAVLELRRPADGAVLAANDDIAGTSDAALDYVVPKELDALIVAIRDVNRRGGAGSIYRLTVNDAAPLATATPSFRLSFDQERYNVVQGGGNLIRVHVERRGYAGPIELDFGTLPPGVAAAPKQIPAGAEGVLVHLSGATEGSVPMIVSIKGRAAQGLPVPITRTARCDATTAVGFQPWLDEQFALVLTSRGGVAFDATAVPAEPKLVLGRKLPVTLRCVRPAGFDGAVRMTLVTNQRTPRVNAQPDVNRALRYESNQPAMEIPQDGGAVAAWDAKVAADKVVADARMALSAAEKAVADAKDAGGTPHEAAEKNRQLAETKVQQAAPLAQAASEQAEKAAASAKNELALNLFVPAELVGEQGEIGFRAELLSRDRQRVLMTLSTPVVPLPVINPIQVVYSGPETHSVTLDKQAGASLKLTGKIERLEGLTGDIAVTIIELPPSMGVPRVVLNAQSSDFELELKFPPNFVAGELRGVAIVATGKIDPAAPLETRSKPVPVGIVVVPAETPVEKKP